MSFYRKCDADCGLHSAWQKMDIFWQALKWKNGLELLIAVWGGSGKSEKLWNPGAGA
jgi:hypothetical protein